MTQRIPNQFEEAFRAAQEFAPIFTEREDKAKQEAAERAAKAEAERIARDEARKAQQELEAEHRRMAAVQLECEEWHKYEDRCEWKLYYDALPHARVVVLGTKRGDYDDQSEAVQDAMMELVALAELSTWAVEKAKSDAGRLIVSL